MSKRKRRVRGWSISKQAQADERPRSGTFRPVAIASMAAFALVLVAAAIAGLLFLQPDSDGPSGPPRAAIVDQLSTSFPNQQFVDDATAMLEEAGYVVDYVPGEDVTISLYYDLPEQDYEYVLLRSHQAQFEEEWRGVPHDEPVLFTADLYDADDYAQEQWDLELTPVHVAKGQTRYFGVTANFIESRMQGDFDGATVVMMGCGGLHTERTAEAFIERGAGAVVGWDELVSSSHTDAVTLAVLDKVLRQDQSVESAVAQAMAEVGPDPAFQSVLHSYPPPFPAGG